MYDKKANSIRSVFWAASCGLSVVGFSTIATAATIVDTELSLLVDLSSSVDSSEYSLQVDGYVNAFRNIDFTNTNFAANFVVWSSSDSQQEVIPWTQITDNASANAFADAIAAALLPEFPQRPFFGSTAPGSAINFATPLFGTETGGADNGFTSTRQIIDISGDGQENTGDTTPAARDAALAAGVDTINALPILTDDPDLDEWYRDNVIGGTDPLLFVANDFPDFATAIEQKIEQEVVTPTPPTPTPPTPPTPTPPTPTPPTPTPPTPTPPDNVQIPEPTTLFGLFGLSVFGFCSRLSSRLKGKQR
ncbi:MAG: DUF1194 domain-containing protein [Hydrococcus sp. Prado102]|jgi:cell division septation protein DedD|nr:DUF1194 domain-containing protein [Hydrococcus sp. Prado102]